MEALIVIGILAAIGAVAFFVWRKKKSLDESQKWRFGTDSRVEVLLRTAPALVTPDGHEIYFEPELQASQFAIGAVDLGVDACYDKAECEYPVDRSKHREKICVLPGEPDSRGDPAFKVYINMHNFYYNGEYDKRAGEGPNVDHYILVAGQTCRIGEPYGDVIAIPFHDQSQAAHCQTIVDFEFEHILLSWHDGPRDDATRQHGTGMGHPLLAGDCLPKGLVASPALSVTCKDNLMVTK